MKEEHKSIIFGLVTILLWSSLATFGNLLLHLPPFYVLGLSFIIGSLPAFFKYKEMFPSKEVLICGVIGYFGYHFFLFYSFRFAPAIEANLINYTWPVILVVLTPVFFPDSRLKWFHYVGVVFSLMGTALLVAGKGGQFQVENFKGYLLAAGAAITWPLYSLIKKRLGAAPIWSIGTSCFFAGVLCLITHLFIEPRVVLQTPDAIKIFFMGIGPFGAAFYTWDLATRKGDMRIIGSLTYLTPVLSTLALVLVADQNLNSSTLLAMVLIVGGASMGILDFLPRNKIK